MNWHLNVGGGGSSRTNIVFDSLVVIGLIGGAVLLVWVLITLSPPCDEQAMERALEDHPRFGPEDDEAIGNLYMAYLDECVTARD